MKKTKKTVFTAALLSAAVALQTETLIQSQASDIDEAPVYGPPPAVRGDMNYDGKSDILDYILLKSKLVNEDGSDISQMDLNADNNINENDLKVFQRYLFGKIPDVQNIYPEDRDDRPSSVTEPIQNIPQPKYGVYPIPETTEPTYTVPQPVYGTCPIQETTEPTYSTTQAQPVYGTYPIQETVEQPVYDTDEAEETTPAVTTVPDEPELMPTDSLPQGVYGPPSFFE